MIGLMVFGSIGIIGLIFFTILYKIKSNKWRALFASFVIFCAWGSLNAYKLSSDYKLLQDKCSDNSQYIVRNTLEADYLNTAYGHCSVGRRYMNNSYFKGFDCKETGYKIAEGIKVRTDFYYRYHRDKFMRDKCGSQCAYYIEEIPKPEIDLTVESDNFKLPGTNVHVASRQLKTKSGLLLAEINQYSYAHYGKGITAGVLGWLSRNGKISRCEKSVQHFNYFDILKPKKNTLAL